MRKFSFLEGLIFGAIIMVVISASATTISEPPPDKELTTTTFNYLKELRDRINVFDITTTAPNGTRIGAVGESVIYNNSGVFENWINEDGSTLWQKI